MMKRHWNRKGFTMAEVLIVVAIIVVLAGVGFIALMSHMRNMEKLELDGQAKEIFVAAQNHLALADSQGYLGRTGFGTKEDENPEHDVYYYVVGIGSGATSLASESDILGLMLPFAAVDESARVSGSYIIRYEKSTATVLDVFYAKTTGRYKLATGLGTDDYTDEKLKGFINGSSVDLKNYGDDKAVVGYYGGVQAANLKKGDPLNAPGIQVINGDKLLVIVTDNNDSTSNIVDGHQTNLLSLTISGSTQYEFTLSPSAANASTTDRLEVDSTGKIYTITLDDLTVSGMHFSGLKNGFIPGEDITVQATAYNNTVITNVAESAQLTTNSLFESISDPKGANTVANIGYLRHFLNLDKDVSGLKEDNAYITVEKAVQTADLSWTDFKTNVKKTAPQIYATSATSAAGFFLPVYPVVTMAEYDGGNHKISDIAVNCSGNAGLFGTIDPRSSCNVHDLELVDFNIKTTGTTSAAGALAGSTTHTAISGVLVHNSELGGGDSDLKIEGGSAVGGLVGTMSGGSVDMSAAAVYVSASGDAGGLIGSATGTVTVSNSYSGGHTVNGKYVETADAFNVISGSGNAGGLIGSAQALTLSYSYSTASARSNAASGSHAVGGLVGVVGSSTDIDYCYAAGLVDAAAEATSVNSFVGKADSTSGWANNLYLSGISQLKAEPAGMTYVSSASASEGSLLFISNSADRSGATSYDQTLAVLYGGKYTFKTVDQLHGSSEGTWHKADITNVHVGDWQVPTMSPLNFMLLNGDTLDLVIELKENVSQLTFAVTGETSKITRIFTLGLQRSGDNWTITSAKESAAGEDGSLKKNENDITSSFTGRFAPFAFTSTTYPVTGFTYPSYTDTAKGKRTASKTVGATTTTETVYDVKITLDDITGENGHFAQLLANDHSFQGSGAATEMKLIPGENISVRVSAGEVSWSELKNVKYKDELTSTDETNAIKSYTDNNNLPADFHYCAHCDNSTFANSINATRSNIATMSSASIKFFRHLENLDSSTSAVNNDSLTAAQRVTTATMEASLDWQTSGYTTIYNYNGTKATTAKTFVGIYNKHLTTFNGNEKTISNLTIDSTLLQSSYGDSIGNAGLFRRVHGGLTISKLHLENLTVNATECAGAFIGLVDNDTSSTPEVKLDTVLAEGATSAVTGTTAAGGLVGKNLETLKINNSAASVYVTATGGAAGGLLGVLNKGTAGIENSYAGGHTQDSVYTKLVSGEIQGIWSVQATGAAGGLVGEIDTGTTLTMKQTFTTAAVSGGTGAAGGLVGTTAGTMNLNYVYTVAPVAGAKVGSTGSNGALVGARSGDSVTASDVYFLPEVYSEYSGYTYGMVDGSKVCSVAPVGSGGSFSGIGFATYYPDDSAGASTGIIAISSGDTNHTNLETNTQIYDTTLKATSLNPSGETVISNLEFPFTIWTDFGKNGKKDLHFYGDWQPAKTAESELFTFYFYMYLPQSGDLAARVTSIGSAVQMAIRLEPFDDETQLTIPTLPYMMGYDYGTGTIAAASLDSAMWLDASASNYVWSVYYGNKSAGELLSSLSTDSTLSGSAGAAKYTRIGNSLTLRYADIKKAYDTSSKNITLVAHYNPAPGQYTLTFMDYDPNGVKTVTTTGEGGESTTTTGKIGLSPSDSDYSAVGTITLIPSLNGDKKLSDYYGEGSDNRIHPIRRNHRGYRFLGWYLGDSPVFPYSDNAFTLNDRTITGNIVLKAKYEEVQYNTVTLHFLRAGTGSTSVVAPDYKLTYESGDRLRLSIPIPSKLTGKKVTETADFSADEAPASQIKLETKDGKQYISLNYSGTEQNKDYYVFVETETPEVGYVVRYVMKDTVSVSPGSSDYSDLSSNTYTYESGKTKTFDPIAAGQVLHTPSNVVPDAVNQAKAIPGFKYVARETKTYPYTSANASTYGVTSDKTGTYTVQWIVVVTYERESYWVNYTNLRGSLGDAQFDAKQLKYGEPFSEPTAQPTATNYTFTGWKYFNKEKTEISPVTSMPAHDLTLEAQWQGKPVQYTVLVWLQTADQTGYLLSNYSSTITAPAGATFTGSETTNGFSLTPSGQGQTAQSFNVKTGTSKINEIGYFHYGSVDKVEGSSVINVRYDRNLYTLWFFMGRATGGSLQAAGYVDPVTKKPVQKYLGEDGYFWAYEDESQSDENAYGKVTGGSEDVYVKLTVEDETTYTPKYIYTEVDEPDTTKEWFGIVNNEYVPVIFSGTYTPAGGKSYTTVPSNDNDGEQWGIAAGADETYSPFVELSLTQTYKRIGSERYQEDADNGDHGIVGFEMVGLTKAYDLTGSYQYTQTNGFTGTQFGIVDNMLKELKLVFRRNGTVYEEVQANDFDGTQLGVMDNAITELTGVYSFTGPGYKPNDSAGERYGYDSASSSFKLLESVSNKTQDADRYVLTTSLVGPQYGVMTSGIVSLTPTYRLKGNPQDNKGLREKLSFAGDQFGFVDGTLKQLTITSKRKGYAYKPSTATSGTFYGVDSNGVFQKLTRSNSKWYIGTQEYTGDWFTRTGNENDERDYKGRNDVPYYFDNGSFTTEKPEENWNGKIYARTGNNSNQYQYYVLNVSITYDSNQTYDIDEHRYAKTNRDVDERNYQGDAYCLNGSAFEKAPAGYTGTVYGFINNDYYAIITSVTWKNGTSTYQTTTISNNIISDDPSDYIRLIKEANPNAGDIYGGAEYITANGKFNAAGTSGGTHYGILEEGGKTYYFAVSGSAATWKFVNGGAEYTGQRYEQGTESNASYTGTKRYSLGGDDSTTFVEDENGAYGKNGDYYYKLTDKPTSWKLGDSAYTGVRLRASSNVTPADYDGDVCYTSNEGGGSFTESYQEGSDFYGRKQEGGKTYYYVLTPQWTVKDGGAVYANDKVRFLQSELSFTDPYTGDPYYPVSGTPGSFSQTKPNGYPANGKLYGKSTQGSTDYYFELSAPTWRFPINTVYNGTLYTVSTHNSAGTDYDPAKGIYYAANDGFSLNRPDGYPEDGKIYGYDDNEGFYYEIESTTVWTYGSGTVYTGDRFRQGSESASTTAYTEAIYHVNETDRRFDDGEGASGATLYGRRDASGGQYTYFPLNKTTAWKEKDSGNSYTDDHFFTCTPNTAPLDPVPTGNWRYKRSSTAPYTYELAEDDEGTQYYRDSNGGWVELKIEKEKKYSYGSTHTPYDPANGIYYLIPINGEPVGSDRTDYVPAENSVYYVSIQQRVAFNYWDNKVTDDGDSCDNFGKIGQGLTNPFTGHYDTVRKRGEYYEFFYHITAPYQADIMDRWPDMNWMVAKNAGDYALQEKVHIYQNGSPRYHGDLQAGTTFSFTSWITQTDSQFRKTYSSVPTIKGKYATMSEELIKINGTATPDDGTEPPVFNSSKPASSTSHILLGRYYYSPNHYAYEIYLGGSANGTPDYEILVNSGGDYSGQHALLFTGYGDNPTKSNPNKTVTYNGITYTKINFVYTAKTYKVIYNYKDEDGNVTQKRQENCQYHQSLATYGNYTFVPNDQYTFLGWYDNEKCEGTAFDFAHKTMPDGNLVLYAKVQHKPVHVKFNTNDNTETLPGSSTKYDLTSFTYGDTLDSVISDDTDYIPTKASDEYYDYDFKCWCTKSGTTLTPYSAEQPVTRSLLELYPDWVRKPKAQPATLKIYHVLLTGTIDPSQTSNDPKDYGIGVETNPLTENTDYFVEERTGLTEGQAEVADAWNSTNKPALAGYYPNFVKRTCLLNSGENTLVFLYTKPDTWYYQVEYSIRYTSQEPKEGWSISGVETAGTTTEIVVGTDTVVETTEEFVLIGYEPNDSAAWTENYELYGYQIGTGEVNTDPYSLVERVTGTNRTNPVKIKIILVPDESTIEPEDRVVTYNGKPQADADKTYTSYESGGEKAPIWFDASKASVTIHYMYYSMNNPTLPNKLKTSQVIDAGTYGMRAYITITTSDGTFLIWQSTDDLNNNPPLHLYIEKRIAFLSSAVSQGAAVWTDHNVYFEKGAEGETNQAKKKITNIMNILTSVGGMNAADFGFVSGTYTDETGTTVRFDDKPTAADYSFAASAFRQMPGTSPNIFSFEPVNTTSDPNRRERYRKNYNIYYFYGSLTVADSSSSS